MAQAKGDRKRFFNSRMAMVKIIRRFPCDVSECVAAGQVDKHLLQRLPVEGQFDQSPALPGNAGGNGVRRVAVLEMQSCPGITEPFHAVNSGQFFQFRVIESLRAFPVTARDWSDVAPVPAWTPRRPAGPGE